MMDGGHCSDGFLGAHRRRLLRVRPARVAPALRAERAEDCCERGEREKEACHGVSPIPGPHQPEAEYGRKNDGHNGVGASARLHAAAVAPLALWVLVLRRARTASVREVTGRRAEEDERDNYHGQDDEAVKVCP